MQEPLTLVYLTSEQASMMAHVSRRYAIVQLLESVGAFDIQNGSVTINFDSQGNAASVDTRKHVRV